MDRIRRFEPGDSGWITAAHQTLYTAEWGFDDTFGPLVADILGRFLQSHDPQREAGWITEVDGVPMGCIFCVRLSESIAKLRLFLVLPQARGRGFGGQLLGTCVQFAKDSGYSGMQLWTHAEHEAACALYAQNGWRCVDERRVHSFGVDLTEQTWSLTFGPTRSVPS